MSGYEDPQSNLADPTKVRKTKEQMAPLWLITLRRLSPAAKLLVYEGINARIRVAECLFKGSKYGPLVCMCVYIYI